MTEPRWAFAHRVEATLRDTDGLGHVNNAVYLTWFEEARTRWVFEAMGLTEIGQFGFVLASTTIDFRTPVYLGETVEIRLAVARVGSKSWELAYEGRVVADGRLCVEGRSVQVQYDYATRTSIPIDGAWRRMLEGGD
jgi:acyl-CoA thioester hydrolase